MTPTGLALYVSAIDASHHGTPKAFAKKLADAGASWVGFGGPWYEARDGSGIVNRRMNHPDRFKAYADACHAQGIDPYVWGYPWIGEEEHWADDMAETAGEYNLGIIDSELGANPRHIRKGAGKDRANASATRIVELLAERFAGGCVGLSTFGAGAKMGWFPLDAFTAALAQHFPGRSFIGEQNYTDNGVIPGSLAGFEKVIEAHGGRKVVELVPNFGTYTWRQVIGKRHARPKTADEFTAHFLEFVDDPVAIHAMIGWHERFMTADLWRIFSKMAERMHRGATRLPV